MISGTVVGLQAKINLMLCRPGQSNVEIECVVDTGFEGALTLPPDVIVALKLPYITRISANLADDSNVMTRLHLATIIWQGVGREVIVLAMGRRPTGDLGFRKWFLIRLYTITRSPLQCHRNASNFDCRNATCDRAACNAIAAQYNGIVT